MLIIIGTLLTTISFVPYLRDIIRHGARPRLVSWVIWTVLLGLMASVSFQEHQLASAIVSTVSMFGCFSVVVLGWRYASRSITQLEKVTLVAAGLAIGLWFIFDQPLLALVAALAADCVAYIPTLIHGWTEPDEESWQAYAIGAVGELLVLVAAFAGHATLVGFLYPLYAGLFGLGMVGVIHFSRWWHGGGVDVAAETY